MAENQRQQLNRLLTIIREYTFDRPPNEIEVAFLQLDELDRSKNIDLWIALKSTLRENIHLKDPDVLNFISEKNAANWWRNPSKWLSN